MSDLHLSFPEVEQGQKIRVVIVTNSPAPYRIPSWDLVSRHTDIELHVIFCAPPYIDESVDLSSQGFTSHFLSAPYRSTDKSFMHSDRRVFALLNKINPGVVVTTGYIPTYLYAFFWAFWRRAAHVVLSDGTDISESKLSILHKLIRYVVFRHSASFAGASQGTMSLFRKYGVREDRMHLAQLCTDNTKFHLDYACDRVDFMFCGRFIDFKRPEFALDVAREAAIRLGRRTTLDFVGKGVMEDLLRARAQELRAWVDVRFHGYVAQNELPARYAAARIFLFPSEWDAWGVVANEACAAGLPVIISPHAGAAGDLVVDGINGLVVPLQLNAWVDAAVTLLSDESRYASYSHAARERVANYNFEASSRGMAQAIRQANTEYLKKTLKRIANARGRETKKSLENAVVCIVQATAKHYRKTFFDRLHARLKLEGVRLRVIYSDANPIEALRQDAIELPEIYGCKVSAHWWLNRRILHQSALREVLASDLVIVEQASKHTLNYLLLFLRRFNKIRVAYWGHGQNWQKDGVRWMEPIKRALVPHVDWWFAYTRRVAELIETTGFPHEKMTLVQNSVSVDEIKEVMKATDERRRTEERARLDIPAKAAVGVFCGSLHPQKRVDWLIEASKKIKDQVENFHLIVIGTGPSRGDFEVEAQGLTWVHDLGPRFGAEKAVYLAISDIFLCPGQVGLAVLDAFAAGLPVFTMDLPEHSPEIDYIESGINGYITPCNVSKFADRVVETLLDVNALARYRVSVKETSERFTVDAMVENFSRGVLNCLSSWD